MDPTANHRRTKHKSPRWQLGLCCITVLLTGCQFVQGIDLSQLAFPNFPDPAQVAAPANALPNPLTVQVRDAEFTWNQIVDTVDDYFDIKAENRVQMLGGIMTEGRIETHYMPGATLLEPWRWDSTPGFEKLHATTQSLRRRAIVRVVPNAQSYAIQVIVEKELEDVDRPAHATPGSATPRHDGSLVRTVNDQIRGPRSLGWIPLGRDVSLETEMLQELYARLFNTNVDTQ